MTYDEFKSRLMELADEGYREFAKKGTPTEYPFLGVRLPLLRGLAAEIVRGGPLVVGEFLQHEPGSFEEVLVMAVVIASLPYEEAVSRVFEFLPLVDNWGVCDTWANTFKSVRKHREDFLERVVDPLLSDGRSSEFAVRFGLVCLLSHYVTAEYLAVIFDRILAVKEREEYYIRMAVAWLVAECFVKFPEETWGFLETRRLPKWTQNKAISKICDSYRVPSEVKVAVKRLRI